MDIFKYFFTMLL